MYRYRAWLLLIVVVILITYILCSPRCNSGAKLPFMNKSSNGYYYDTEEQTFASPQDRTTAINTLINMFQGEGITYTSEQISRLSDTFLLKILEPESDEERDALKARVVILVDPDYTLAQVIVNGARKAGNKFDNAKDRALVYGLLVKYFIALKNPINVPLARWSDMLLIRSFKTLTLPDNSEFTR